MTCDEALKVEEWKIEQFVKLGYSRYEATCFVDEGIDYHDVERFIKMGAAHTFAVKLAR